MGCYEKNMPYFYEKDIAHSKGAKRLLFGGVALAYWVGAVALHQQIQMLFSGIARVWGFDSLQQWILWSWFVCAGIFLRFCWKRYSRLQQSFVFWPNGCVWGGFLTGLMLTWCLLSQTRAESIHFLQYGLLFLLLYKALSHLSWTYLMVVLLG